MPDSPFTILQPSLTAIDPSLTYNTSPQSTPPTTSPHSPSTILSHPDDSAQSEHPSPSTHLDHLSTSSSTRAHSQPPEHLK
ncbi:MAG: hypothetical protein M1830_007827, partial [Pleopsidium flavum]